MKRALVLGILCLLAVSVHAQTTVQLPPSVHQQFLDSAGRPLAAGCVNTYGAGTTTPLATYTDSSGSVVNSNPIILDSGGFANIWLQTGVAYKFVITSTGGVNCASGTLQWTVDGITTSSASGGSSATSVTSATSNPASAGVIRLAKSDTVCWRNASNAANLCLSLDSSNNLTWGGISLFLTEGACPSGVSGEDGICADSTAHRFKMVNNAGSAVQIVGSGVDINTSDQVTVTHLAAALPTAQGGTGSTSASTGSGGVVLANSPSISSPTNSHQTITTGIVNSGSGFQHVRFTSCVVSSGTCDSTASWNASFADTNYTIVCSLIDNTPEDFSIIQPTSKASGSFNYTVQKFSGSDISGREVDCIGVHD